MLSVSKIIASKKSTAPKSKPKSGQLYSDYICKVQSIQNSFLYNSVITFLNLTMLL